MDQILNINSRLLNTHKSSRTHKTMSLHKLQSTQSPDFLLRVPAFATQVELGVIEKMKSDGKMLEIVAFNETV